MNCKRVALGTVVGFVVLTALNMLVHGSLLNDFYKETADLWRTADEMSSRRLWAHASTALFAFGVSNLWDGISSYYQKTFPAMKVGFGVGALFAGAQLMHYTNMPVPLTLVLSWSALWMVNGLVMGFLLQIMNKNS